MGTSRGAGAVCRVDPRVPGTDGMCNAVWLGWALSVAGVLEQPEQILGATRSACLARC